MPFPLKESNRRNKKDKSTTPTKEPNPGGSKHSSMLKWQHSHLEDHDPDARKKDSVSTVNKDLRKSPTNLRPSLVKTKSEGEDSKKPVGVLSNGNSKIVPKMKTLKFDENPPRVRVISENEKQDGDIVELCNNPHPLRDIDEIQIISTEHESKGPLGSKSSPSPSKHGIRDRSSSLTSSVYTKKQTFTPPSPRDFFNKLPKDTLKSGKFGVKIKTLLKDKSASVDSKLVVNDVFPRVFAIDQSDTPVFTKQIRHASNVPMIGMVAQKKTNIGRRRHSSGPSTLGQVRDKVLQGIGDKPSGQTFSDDLGVDDIMYVYKKTERLKSLIRGEGDHKKSQFEAMTSDSEKAVVQFMKMHSCYDVMPRNSKLVVLDTRLPAKKAFQILIVNGLRATALWNHQKQAITGILTITDFIRILLKHYDAIDLDTEHIQEQFILNWRNDLTAMGLVKPLIYITPDKSLYDALETLFQAGINRLPVLDKDTGNMLHILTMKRILQFLFLHLQELPRREFMLQPLQKLKIGTYDNLQVVKETDHVYTTLRKFLTHKISSLPIVDDDHRCLGVYAKYDIMNLAGENMFHDLNITIQDALQVPNHSHSQPMFRCYMDEKFKDILKRFISENVHRLVICTRQDKLLGILTLSDVLRFLVMKHTDTPGSQGVHHHPAPPAPAVHTQ